MSKKPKLAIFQQAEEEDERGDDNVKPVKPIPLPSRTEANTPLLNDMKRIRDDPAEFQRYVDTRPKALSPTDSAYNDTMPVESFGLAMLRGMGYNDEDKQVQPYLLEGRPGLLGLGAKIVHEKQASAAAPRAAANKQRKYICNGSVCQLAGTHRLVVVKQTDGVPGLDMIKVEAININGQVEELVVPKQQLILQDLDRLPETHPAHSIVGQVEAAHAARQRDEAKTQSSRLWIQPDLRVLVTQEKSNMFKKKGWIVSVNEAEKTCVVRIGEAEYEFKERHLQTTVELGKRAIIVRGALKQRVGVVEDKDKKRALVRFDKEAVSVEWIALDDVCEVKSNVI